MLPSPRNGEPETTESISAKCFGTVVTTTICDYDPPSCPEGVPHRRVKLAIAEAPLPH
jgi:hypothetical protein